MTDKPNPPETPGMAEVSARFVDGAEAAAKAAARKARDAVEAVMKEVGPIGDDETLIQNTYRKVLALRAARPRDMPDEALDEWIGEHDRLEEKIGTFPAETLRDVETKLAILCDRLRENLSPQHSGDANDIIIALAARDDLGRLAPGAAATHPPAVAIGGAASTTESPVHDALNGLADSLSMVDTARHALGSILEDMSGQPGEDIGFCILRTLDAAAEQGEASFDIVWKAMKGKAKAEARSALADACGLAGESALMTDTHSPVDLRDQWDRLRLDLEVLNRKHDQLSDSEYGKRFDDIVQALGGIETAITDAPANDWQTVLVKLHVAVGLAQDQVGKLDKHDHPFVELLRTVTCDVGRLAGEARS